MLTKEAFDDEIRRLGRQLIDSALNLERFEELKEFALSPHYFTTLNDYRRLGGLSIDLINDLEALWEVQEDLNNHKE